MKVRLTSRAERVSAGELPHASEQLRESSDEERHADDDVGDCDVVCLYVDEG